MNNIAALFTLAPVVKGFIALMISGACFPLCGVMVVRLDLIPMRYMLMHGVILGGAIALALSLPVIPVSVVINILLVFLLLLFTKDSAHGFSTGSAASMVLSMALASLVMHIADVPAKDTLSLIWGSPFALNVSDIVLLIVISLLLILYIVFNFRSILALFYNQEIASSLGIRVHTHYTIMVLLIAFVVATAMKLLGAFLIDALLLLPVLITSSILSSRKKAAGIKMLFILSCFIGFLLATIGFIIAVIFDLPPSSAIALLAGLLYFITGIHRKRSSK
jgi:zinc transport system permease protein